MFLQCIEAEIYVDKIYLPLREQSIPCFTRHDSVVVAWEFQGEVESHIESVFAGLGFRYNPSYSDMSVAAYSYDELEKNGHNDYWADRLDIDDFTYEGDFIPFTSNGSGNNSSEDYDDMDVIDPDLLDELQEIGIQDDYSDAVNQEFLTDLLGLPLTDKQFSIVEAEIIDVEYDKGGFDDETNQVIRDLVIKYT